MYNKCVNTPLCYKSILTLPVDGGLQDVELTVYHSAVHFVDELELTGSTCRRHSDASALSYFQCLLHVLT